MPSIPSSPNACPVDLVETAAAYIMKRLSTADALHFAIHFLTCPQCTAAVEEAEDFECAMKELSAELSAEAHDRPRISSSVTLISFTILPPGSVRAQMRFEVTILEDPHARQ